MDVQDANLSYAERPGSPRTDRKGAPNFRREASFKVEVPQSIEVAFAEPRSGLGAAFGSTAILG
jgi:hypothetical protein